MSRGKPTGGSGLDIMTMTAQFVTGWVLFKHHLLAQRLMSLVLQPLANDAERQLQT
jgi:hypothetical protein